MIREALFDKKRFLKNLWLHLLIIIVCVGASSPGHTSLSCKEKLEFSQIFLGDEVSVQVNIRGVRRIHPDLIFIGESSGRGSKEKILVFSDARANIYYYESSNVLINNRPAKYYDFSKERLPHLLEQTEGSCNLCANVSAINQLALDSFLEPISLSIDEIETSKTADIFSGEASYRLLFQTLYDTIWPEGYVRGGAQKPAYSQLEQIVTDFMIRNMNALSRSLEYMDLDLGPEYIKLPLKVRSRHTYSLYEFFRHLQEGGTAVVAGLIVSDQQIISHDMSGRMNTINLPRLTPLITEGGGDGDYEVSGDPVDDFIQSKDFNTLLNALMRGKRPNKRFVKNAIKLLIKNPGHAVAALRQIEDGPLEGYIVVINSWGTFEIHPPSNFSDNLNYVLIGRADRI